jgi:hypothetical protein
MLRKRTCNGMEAWHGDYRVADAADAEYDETGLFLGTELHRAMPINPEPPFGSG